jgi:tRNA-Thr(GGU) m(6)t(6)A37 methyltransferase TsaA
MNKIGFTPIGYVHNDATENTHSEEFRRMESVIIIDPKYGDGLMGIEVNELITVVFFFDRNDGYSLRLHPRGDISRPITGVFNTRSQMRPNPIGITVVKLKSRKGNKLLVEGLDALDGTPVLDIKPHVLTFDEGVEIDDPGKDRALKAVSQQPGGRVHR